MTSAERAKMTPAQRNATLSAALVAALVVIVVIVIAVSRTGAQAPVGTAKTPAAATETAGGGPAAPTASVPSSGSNGSAGSTGSTTAAAPVTPGEVVREDSHRLSSTPNAKVTVVEFLDFECEACGAFYPHVEQLRQDYDGQVNFVVRYFPLAGHKNSGTAALAVEAAAQQGKFEQMYSKMFETQHEWGEKQDSQAPLFRTYAEQLGLDLAAYDKALADPATTARIEKDRADGLALRVTATPTFFVNGEAVDFSGSQDPVGDLRKQIDDGLAK